jgi:hypothetical protein
VASNILHPVACRTTHAAATSATATVEERTAQPKMRDRDYQRELIDLIKGDNVSMYS